VIRDNIRFSKELEKVNEWWLTSGLTLPKLLKRECLDKIIKEFKGARAIQITGPRRVGKTTLIKQAISYLLSNKILSTDILFLSLDDPVFHTLSDSLIEDAINFFLENVSKGNYKKYIFLDEIQVCKEWYKWIKSFYDKYSENGKIKFVLSGSSSLSLQKEANVYLRGRIQDFEIYPFSFKEFLQFNNIKVEKINFSEIERIKPLDVSSLNKRVKPYFDEYLLVGGFPEWFKVKDVKNWFEKIINDIPKKAIYEDIINIFNIKSPRILENIFAFILENQSRILSYETINEIAGLQRSILLNYIEYLKSSYLLVEVQKFTKRVKERIKSKKKFLVLDQGIRNAILKEYKLNLENIGFIIENVIGLHLYKNGEVYYFKVNEEIDFILRHNKLFIPIEAKYRERVKVPKSMMRFMQKYDTEYGFVITRDIFKKEEINLLKKGEIYFIPAWLFLLMEFDVV